MQTGSQLSQLTDEFRIGTAETYDVIVEPTQSNYQIEAESIDRSGFAIGTLHNENAQAVGQFKYRSHVHVLC